MAVEISPFFVAPLLDGCFVKVYNLTSGPFAGQQRSDLDSRNATANGLYFCP